MQVWLENLEDVVRRMERFGEMQDLPEEIRRIEMPHPKLHLGAELRDLYSKFRGLAASFQEFLIRISDRSTDREDCEHRLFVLEERVRTLDLRFRFSEP